MPKKTLAETTAEQIKELIQRNSYEPGQKLPTEKELCEMLGVGRNTLREAERILQSHNIVTIRQGSGTYISEKYGVPDDPFGFDLFTDHEKLNRDILEILVILEPEMVSMAAERRTKEDLKEMEKVLREMSKKVDMGLNCIEEECEFYRVISEASHNIVMSRMLPLMKKGVRYFATTLTPRDFLYGLRNYHNVLDAIREQEVLDANRSMRYHLSLKSKILG